MFTSHPHARSKAPPEGKALRAGQVTQRLDTPCGLKIDIHQNVTTIVPYLSDWSDLVDRCSSATFFAGPAWASAWMERRMSPHHAVSLIIVRTNGRIAALLALTTRRFGPLRVGAGLCNGSGAYTELLADVAAVPRQRLLAAVWRGLDELGIDTLTFDAVPEGSMLDALLSMRSDRRGPAQRSVEVAAGSCGGSASLRKDLRRRRRRLTEEKGALDYRVVTLDNEIPYVISALLTLKLTWLDEKGLHARFLASDEVDGWLVAVCSRALREGQLHLSTLSAGGRIVVVQLAFRSGRKLSAYIAAFDTAYKRYGVGKLHLEDHLTDIAAHRLALDLMPPEDDYKLEWGVPGVRVWPSVTPLTARGRALAVAQNPNLREAMKRVYLAIPRRIRARTAAAILAMAAAVRRSFMGLAASLSELAPHIYNVAVLA